ncbi:ABC transporter permease [Pseudonocardia sp.]|uniref:ABC transporter permease n=1 Tax=Pseudonocardia sp. TaxID=60912 RepID=UPI00263096C1|nr:ABC transporter permease [Pseudonocardia sp.]
MSGALRLVAGRFGQALAAAFGASILVWALVPLAPGDPALRVLTSRGVSDPQPLEIEAVRIELGLDRPLVAQYLDWLSRAVRGDLSESYRTGRPVLDELVARLPATALLAGVAIAIAVLAALPAALLAAAWAGRWPDALLRGLALVGAAMPAFLVGLILLQVVVLGQGWGRALSDGAPSQVWLPALVLALGRVADWSRLLRASLLESAGSGYTLVAAARGASRARVLLVHALPNALLPFLTAVGVGIGVLIGGTPIVEAVFTWPGIGGYVVQAINARDLPVIQGFAALAALAYVATSLTVDVIGGLLDPRTRKAAA